MLSYLVRRLLGAGAVLLVMSFVVYLLLGLMPGDPIDLMASGDPNMTTDDVRRLKELYGLDRPLLERYGLWLAAALQGDFGFSRLYAVPVMDVLLPRLGNTCLLMGAAFLISVVIAIPAGMVAAAYPRSWLDYGINLFAFAGFSIPSFWLALLMILLFAAELGWLPASGTGEGVLGRLHHLVLPVMTLAIVSTASLVRFTRAAMLETMRSDYIRTARAKGVSFRGVLTGHALRNAMIPVVTIIALDFGTLFSGALVVETMFAHLGMGKLIYDAVMGNDFNLALIGLLFATLVTLLANLVADFVYAGLDPRISYAR